MDRLLLACRRSLLAVCLLPVLGAAQERRNPFGLEDVPDPAGAAAKQFAKSVSLEVGDESHPNAQNWTEKPVEGNPMFLDGDWYGRWNQTGDGSWQYGTAKVRRKEDRLFIHYTEGAGGTSYLIEGVLVEKNRFVGSYVSPGSTSAFPWAGRVVDGERIDGIWNTVGGRWDFRRQAVRSTRKKK